MMALPKNYSYYGPEDDHSNTYTLSPIPAISISKEFHYANSVIIGYTYIVNLNGKIVVEEFNDENKDIVVKPAEKGIKKLMGNVEIVRKILSRNGSTLEVQDKDANTVLKAIGGILRSLNFSESPNYWTTSVDYSAQIEFNEIQFLGQNIDCGVSDIDPESKTPFLVDTDRYKIRSFTDNWSFSITGDSFDFVGLGDFGELNIANMEVQVTYTISATGKAYFCDEKTIPAHEQARIFVQSKLYHNVTELITGGYSRLFTITADTEGGACGTETLNTIHRPPESGIDDTLFGDILYLPSDESISCTVSESEGSFSATYSCTLKAAADDDTKNIKHTLSKTFSKERIGKDKYNCTISINGTIEGLIPGGLITSGGEFELPQSGSLLIRSANSGTINKMGLAEDFFDNYIAQNYDLFPLFKEQLGITYENLCINTEEVCEELPESPTPSNFTLTKNYTEGTINYSAEYTSERACEEVGKNSSISVTSDGGTDVIAEFVVPNGNTIIQDIGTKTAKRITISIQGNSGEDRSCCEESTGLSGLINSAACNPVSIPSGIGLPTGDDFIITQLQRSDNKKDGTYNMTISYLCATVCDL
jgi:hypothetical protein